MVEVLARQYVHVNVSCKNQERVIDTLELEFLVIATHLTCLLGTELSSAGKGSMHSESLSHLSSSYRYNFNSGERNTDLYNLCHRLLEYVAIVFCICPKL